MPGSAIGEVRALIERWDIHRDPMMDLPVPIERIARLEGFRICWGSTFPVMGYAIVGKGARFIRVDSRMSEPWQRLTIAHELGHVLAHHAGRAVDDGCRHECAIDRLQDPDELEATLLGLAILVPRAVVDLGWDAAEIARRCMVPIGPIERLLSYWREPAVPVVTGDA